MAGEKLQLRSDGAFETSEGHFGIVMKHISGENKDMRWFSFRPDMFGSSLRVEWEPGTMAIVVDANTAKVLVRHGYARGMTQEEADKYNAEVTPAPSPPSPPSSVPPEPPKTKPTITVDLLKGSTT